MVNLIAKRDTNGKEETLWEHSHKTMLAAVEFCNTLQIKDKSLKWGIVFGAGVHDIGKIDDNFQSRLADNRIPVTIPHNVVSGAIINSLVSFDDNLFKELLVRAVTLHHTVGVSNGDVYTNYEKYLNDETRGFIQKVIEETNILTGVNVHISINYDDVDDIFRIPNKLYLNYSDPLLYKNQDTKLMIMHVGIRVSDVIASGEMKLEELASRINKDNIVFTKPEFYDNRFFVQEEYTNKLNNQNNSVFIAPTGFGKTEVGVMWSLSDTRKRKTYIVTPTNSIAIADYYGVKNTIKNHKLDNAISVGLLLTDKWVYGSENSDIVVTNIDNFIRPSFKNNIKLRGLDMLGANCIFDEFHEYVSDAGIMAAFITLINARTKFCPLSRNLLLSATPVEKLYNNGEFQVIDHITGVDKLQDTVCEKMLSKKIRIHFDDTELLNMDYRQQNTLTITQSVSLVQQLYSLTYYDNCIHSRYTDSDLTAKLDDILDKKGKGKTNDNSLVATSIIGTGADISFRRCNLVMPTAEMLIQIGTGRVNRWLEMGEEIPDLHIISSSDRTEIMALETYSSKDYVNDWINFLKTNIEDGETIEVKRLYELRNQYLQSPNNKFNKLFKDKLPKSFENLATIPYLRGNKPLDDSDKQYVSSSKSIRDNDDNSQNFFFKVMSDETGEIINEAMTGSQWFFGKDMKDIKRADVLQNFLQYIKTHDDLWMKYFATQRGLKGAIKKLNSGYIDDVFNQLLKTATCDETPLIITTGYYYNSKLGFYRNQKQ